MPRALALYRFPIKGLPAQPLNACTARVGTGFDGDRAAALSNGVAAAAQGRWDDCGHFTVLKNDTSLQQWQIACAVREAAAPQAGPDTHGSAGGCRAGEPSVVASDISLTAPDGARALIRTDEPDSVTAGTRFLAGRLESQGAHPRELIVADQGMFDSQASGISLINPASVAVLGRAAGDESLDPLRFRGNVLLEGLGPFEEFDLVGRILRIGGVRMWIRSTIERCPATRVNPVSAAVDVNVPRLLAAHLGHLHCGIYGVVLETGEIRAGDEIVIEDRPLSPIPPPGFPAALRKPLTGPRSMEVTATEVLDGSAVRLRLRDPLGFTAEQYAPGMHVRVHLVHDGLPLWRTYTLTRVTAGPSDTGRPKTSPDELELLVGLDGTVSHLLADLTAGDRLLVSGPFGRITARTLPGRTGVLTAGIGITPALALARGMAANEVAGPLAFFHVERGTEPGRVCAALVDAAAEAGAPLQRWSTAGRGRPDPAALEAVLAAWSADLPLDDIVICGPASFTAACREAAERFGLDPARIHSEVFASPLALDGQPPDLSDARIAVEDPGARGDGGAAAPREVPWTRDEGFILDALETAGVPAPYSCRGGSCGECALRLLAGSVVYPLEPAAQIAPGEVLTCSAYPEGDIGIELR
ncbi:2Fe-2S iron-sulfur cluster binding domain-containing protein [Brevibacterium sp. 5221]|uniref:2Fe-2S iron-sulfur cluster binding domain-containing protein n=1 Tax=Brevibacterium rongguiense TaxID=2695267 RepID=A0A6N9H774_9MICO|nr:2Fe-2S iron-sulfur cluster-binding protein [Brevibacterium rongguiense]MYM19947.1 2Fe-2S iron-sulfur cluster binding domain-containing protein [Brevibacterium rongguiense]